MRLSHRLSTAIAMAATGAFAIAAPGAAAASAAAGAGHRSPIVSQHAAAVPGGTQLWAQRFGGAHLTAYATSVAASPDKSAVYVTGFTVKSTGLRDYVTAAYSAATGAQLWRSRYQGTVNHPRGDTSADIPSITVSPDGSTVFVAGDLAHGTYRNSYLILAYNAATGAQAWVAGYGDASIAGFRAVAVSPDSATVFVTGTQDRVGGSAFRSYLTVALNASTGNQLWVAQTVFPRFVPHTVTSIAVSPDGSKVFVGGSSGTVAYNAATGAQLWLDRYKLAWERFLVSLAVSPDSATVYVTSGSSTPTTVRHYWTAAISAVTGAKLWQATYHGAGTAVKIGTTSLALSPDGSAVYVTGTANANEYTTIAYAAATGKQLWLAQSPNKGDTGTPAFIAASPDGSKVAVTGSSAQANGQLGYETAAFAAGTGARLWTAAYQGPGGEPSSPAGIVFSHTGARVIVTGSSGPSGGPSEYATVGYQS